MSAPPWAKFNFAHFVADTQHLSCEERGAYIALIAFYWQKGGLPDDDEKLARIVGLDAMRWQCVRNAMVELFRPGWRHKRIDEELARANEKSKKAADSANNRWKNKKKTKNANASKAHVPAQCEGNAIETTDNIEISKDISKPTPRSILLECLSPETADGVLAHRKAKKAPLTLLAAQQLVKGFLATGDPEAAATMMVARGWQGFEPGWFTSERSGGKGGGLRSSTPHGSRVNGHVFVKLDTPQWSAWAERMKADGKSPPSTSSGGWWFPSEWPRVEKRSA